MRPLRELLYFLTNTLSMTDVYQPAIILYLLEHGGAASRSELAQELTKYDRSIHDYYVRVVMRWPKITLTKHAVVNYDRKSKSFTLNFDLVSQDVGTLDEVKRLCRQKISDWIKRRVTRPSEAHVGASVRYRVLKAAHGKCELCGISSKLIPIDVDHIVPRTRADKQGFIVKDGTRMLLDDERNLQALCMRCNRAKRDTDSADFRFSTKKLVRDNIPKIIAESGRSFIAEQVKGDQLREMLFDKLIEEHAELLETPSIEELIDMIEVILAIAQHFGYSEREVQGYLEQKRNAKGAFSTGTVLMRIE